MRFSLLRAGPRDVTSCPPRGDHADIFFINEILFVVRNINISIYVLIIRANLRKAARFSLSE